MLEFRYTKDCPQDFRQVLFQDHHQNQGAGQGEEGTCVLCHGSPQGHHQIELADNDDKVEMGGQIPYKQVAQEAGQRDFNGVGDKEIGIKQAYREDVGNDHPFETGEKEFFIGKSVGGVMQKQLDAGEKEKALYHERGEPPQGKDENV